MSDPFAKTPFFDKMSLGAMALGLMISSVAAAGWSVAGAAAKFGAPDLSDWFLPGFAFGCFLTGTVWLSRLIIRGIVWFSDREN